MKICLASDHAGFALKEIIRTYLEEKGYTITDFGCFNTEPIDYVDTGLLAAEHVAMQKSDFGVLICGTGQGMNIIANKVKGIRAALCHTKQFAQLARMHNNANILVLAGRFIDQHAAIDVVDAFLNEPFSDEIRHFNRIEKINKYESVT